MGAIYNINCEGSCYFNTFKVGIGMVYFPANILDISQPDPLLHSLFKKSEMRDRIEYLISHHKANINEAYGYDLFCCPHCCNLENHFHLELIYDEKLFETTYLCSSCNIPLNRLKFLRKSEAYMIDTLKNIPCPSCKKSIVNLELTLLWD